MIEKDNNLDANFLDHRVATYKAIIGLVPGFGSILSEVVGAIIPDQRMDRLVQYIKLLDEKVQKIDSNLLENAKQNELIVDLIEEGFVQASRSLSNERREYIANVVANGISDEEKNYVDSKYVLRLLGELNDQEVIWLRFFLEPTINGDKEFRQKHQNVIEPVRTYIGVEDNILEKRDIQESYKSHLERLGLIKSKYRIDKKTGLPQFDQQGMPQISHRFITPLGKLMLKRIGLIDSANT
ncbi:hypothetical protein IIQ43_15895 [Acinetobacter oleivorans]|uniref:DUF4393 domain-containing protein n=1 Tax=Acinetobacter oleivorans TaxID=1148157 RepID=A0ABR9NMQ9_9GAMM|nr:hypothetical protein [Acinetobacter oleivorans]MBE2166002.1 hypothetical protein [Acinetobacter oleivorans]